MNSESKPDIAWYEARIRDLEATLRQNDQSLITKFNLTPMKANILGLLIALPVATPYTIQQRLELTSNAAKVQMCRLRDDLKKLGLKIESCRNVGYWLDVATKQKIKDMLADDAPSTAPDLAATPPDNKDVALT